MKATTLVCESQCVFFIFLTTAVEVAILRPRFSLYKMCSKLSYFYSSRLDSMLLYTLLWNAFALRIY